MDFKDVISTRRSIRSFTGQEVSDELLDQLIRAAMMAPSATNQQPWHFIVVRDREKLRAIIEFHPYAAMMKNAPTAIVVCADPVGKKSPDFFPQDCAAAVQNMLLAGRDLGLGMVWVGIYPRSERIDGMRKLFNIPKDIIPFAIVPVGWPDAGFKTKDRFNPARIHHETW